MSVVRYSLLNIFEVIVGEIVFLNFLLAYRKTMNFCKLILFPASLLKVFIVRASGGTVPV
jgi:hypothetical protein